MEQYKKDFIDFMVESQVLTFGDFTTKSGRKTPFFVNTGNYDTGKKIAKLGEFYAETIKDRYGLDFDLVYGPAYKGIPLAVTISSAIYTMFDKNIGFTFNRKEAKDHGEGGSFVGYKLADQQKVIIVEDVITAGTAMRENLPILKDAADLSIEAIIVSVDRMEKGSGELSAIQEIEKDYQIPVHPIVSIDEVVDYLYNREVDGTVIIDDETLERIRNYRNKYGI
jgi:orotate phosphoribosyltransferase